MTNLIKLLIIFLAVSKHTIATPADEALVASAYAQGVIIYNSCIAIPPADPNVVAYCTTLYVAYISTLNLVNAPLPTPISSDPSPYSWSPFDICRYEVAHMVFSSVTQTPYYCPTL